MAAKPIGGTSLFRYFLDSNPFYLISACCMLAGCLALTNSLSWLSIPTHKLLILIATLNAYEAALIGLAAYLILGRGLRRDGMVLIVLEAFFLIDITFLDAEIATQKSWVGPAIAAVSFLAAVVKLAVILRILGVRRSPAEFAFILIQIAAILALPIVFSRPDNGTVSPLVFYIAWWIVGLMPAAYELLARFLRPGESSPVSRAVLTYMILPWLSLVAHLGILHYVYDVPFCAAMAAPLLLALALVLNRANAPSLLHRKDALALQILLPLVAILLSGGSSSELTIILNHGGHLKVTPLCLTTAATYLEFVYFFFQSYWIYCLVAGFGCLLFDEYGPTLDQMIHWAVNAWNWISTAIRDLLPTTAVGWGTSCVVAAFVFLVLGAAVSLSRAPSPPRL
ncbi:MAG TPA: hypothetical protein VHX86_06985 [Tepidisphaeraceae bacterium]|jgi:hypothetical protein|nr:hypothetical protein [Tepidisphaeraceae bacterium]